MPFTQIMSFTQSRNLLGLLEKSSNRGFLGTRLHSRIDVLLVIFPPSGAKGAPPEATKSTYLKLHGVWEKANLPVKRSRPPAVTSAGPITTSPRASRIKPSERY